MILGHLNDVSRILGCHPAFPEAFAWLRAGGGGLWEREGAHPGFGPVARVIVEHHARGKNPAEARLEAHDKMLDIQYCIEGEETFGYKARAAMKIPDGDFNADRDLGFWKDAPDFSFFLTTGQFAVFFPEDGHAPGVSDRPFRKVVLKIPAEMTR